jgi:hypothetical protein
MRPDLFRWIPPILVAGALCSGPAAATEGTDADLVSSASPYAHSLPEAQAEQLRQWQAELNLSIEQQAVIGEILADYAARLRPLFQQGAETAWSIMNVAPRDPDYTVDTEAAAQAAAETAAQIVRTVSLMRNAIHSVMTVEQIATLERLIEEQRAAIRARIAEREAAQSTDGAQSTSPD